MVGFMDDREEECEEDKIKLHLFHVIPKPVPCF